MQENVTTDNKEGASQAPAIPEKVYATIDAFQAIEIRLGTVISVWL